MKLSKYLSILCLLHLHCTFAQTETNEKTVSGFSFPIRPNQKNYLAGTMGELRTTHFHMGLDIKTSGITGLPVYATADGYIRRIRVSLFGYGNALYMEHPKTGHISVYGHLKSFDQKLATLVRNKQYEQEAFQVSLFPKKNQFYYKKGDIIALSGNSGSSSGPHLHFEIRNQNHYALDPLTFGFDEIVDKTAPILSKVAFVTMDINARVNGMHGRFEFDVTTDAKGYPYLSESISLYGKIGVEIYAYDKMDGVRNKNGIRFQTLSLDTQPIFSQAINNLPFGKSREILVHTNYKRVKEGGRSFNKLYVDVGNTFEFYQSTQAGILEIIDPLSHQLAIRLEDGYGNISEVSIGINGNGFDRSRKYKNTYALDKQGYDIYRHILDVESTDMECYATFYVNGVLTVKHKDYYTDQSIHFLWDMRNGIPDSVKCCGMTTHTKVVAVIPSHTKYNWQGERIKIEFSPKSLFDSMYLRYEYLEINAFQEIFQFDNITTPFRRNVTIFLQPREVTDLLKSRVYAISANGKLRYVGGEWQGDELVFNTKELASYTIATDSVAPIITKKKASAGQMKLRVRDNMSGIHSIRAELDGKWILMNFDAKSGNVWSDDKVNLIGSFSFWVRDWSSNVAEYHVELN